MKNYLIVILLVLILGIGGFLLVKNKSKIVTPETKTETLESQEKEMEKENSPAEEIEKKDYRSAFKGLLNPCELFSKEKVEQILGKQLVNIEFKHTPVSKYTNHYSCAYYQEPQKYDERGVNIAKRIFITFIDGDVSNVRSYEILQNMGYQLKKDKDISIPHWLVYDEKGKFHHLHLMLENDLDLTVETWWSLLSEQEALKFIKDFTQHLKKFVGNE